MPPPLVSSFLADSSPHFLFFLSFFFTHLLSLRAHTHTLRRPARGVPPLPSLTGFSYSECSRFFSSSLPSHGSRRSLRCVPRWRSNWPPSSLSRFISARNAPGQREGGGSKRNKEERAWTPGQTNGEKKEEDRGLCGNGEECEFQLSLFFYILFFFAPRFVLPFRLRQGDDPSVQFFLGFLVALGRTRVRRYITSESTRWGES